MPEEPLIKLLIFAHALQGRGTERSVIRLLKEFDRSILTPEIALASARGEFLQDIPADVPIHDLSVGERRTSAATLRLAKVVQNISPDCIMGVHISAGRVVAALRLLHPRLPVICLEADPFTRIEQEKGHLRLRVVASRVTYKLASSIVAASDVVAQDLIEHLGVNPRKISLIPLASTDESIPELSSEPLFEQPFGNLTQEPIIITIGNMFAHKDQATLIRGFDLVQRSLACHLVLIGEGPARPDLEKLVLELDLSGRVWFLGFQKNPFKYLVRSRVFVSSSTAEGFDISQIEAMACGTPVIVTDAPRFQAVTHGKTGLIIPPRDPKALARAVLQILRSDEMAESLARNAMEAAREFSAQKVARRYETLIKALVGPR